MMMNMAIITPTTMAQKPIKGGHRPAEVVVDLFTQPFNLGVVVNPQAGKLGPQTGEVSPQVGYLSPKIRRSVSTDPSVNL